MLVVITIVLNIPVFILCQFSIIKLKLSCEWLQFNQHYHLTLKNKPSKSFKIIGIKNLDIEIIILISINLFFSLSHEP